MAYALRGGEEGGGVNDEILDSHFETMTREWQDSYISEKRQTAEADLSKLFGARETIIKLIRLKIAGDPMVKRLVRYLGKKDVHFTEPWQAYADKKIAALQIAENANRLSEQDAAAGGSLLGMSLKVLSPQCATYLWTNKVHDLVRSAPSPRCRISSVQLPYDTMFFSNETAHVLGNSESDWSILSRVGPDGILMLFGCNDKKTREIQICHAVLPGNLNFPEDLSGNDALLVPPIGNVINRISFIRESIYVDTVKRTLTKEQSRSMSAVPASIAPVVDPEIHVCTLRRKIEEYRQSLADAGQIEWKHQWWVCGHERNQWYAKDKCWRKIWVAPYIKGPADMPFLQKVYAVAR